jgi:hypothetical protein
LLGKPGSQSGNRHTTIIPAHQRGATTPYIQNMHTTDHDPRISADE